MYAGTAPTSVLPIFVLVIGYGTARAFAMPATRSLPADTVPAARLPWLVARQSVTWQAAAIVGPVLAGFLYAADVQLPFFMAVGLLVGRRRSASRSCTRTRTTPRSRVARPRP